MFTPLAARANPPQLPSGGHFVAGAGSLAQSGNSLQIHQTTSRGVIDWRDFSIGQGNKVNIANGSGATLNRVTGGQQSSILGSLTGTGSIYLINPAGVVIGAGGKIVTGGSFVASSRDISNPQFMAGGALSAAGSGPGNVLNQGSISSTSGDVVLIGQNVANQGSITAPNGTAALVAGNQVMLDAGAKDGNVAVAISGGGNVSQSGEIAAAAAALDAAQGNVYAMAGNTGGTVAASGTTSRGGQIWLSAGGAATVSGTLAAHNHDGSGGHVVIMSAKSTDFSGHIDARPTLAQAKGGMVEVSSAGHLAFTGQVALNAPGGSGGELLLDPENLTIAATGPSTATAGTGSFISNVDNSVLTVASLQAALAAGNVTLQTGAGGKQAGDINIAANVAWSGSNSLTLSAYHNIILNAGVSVTQSGSGSLTLRADNTGDGSGAVALNGQINFAGSTGHVTIFYNPAGGYSAPVDYSAGIAVNPGVTSQVTAYMLVNSLANLQALGSNQTGIYALGRAINAAGANFTPIAAGFAGTLYGQGLTISGLTVNGTGAVGLFSSLASPAVIYDLTLSNAAIANNGVGDTGILAGDNAGIIAGVAASGTVTGHGGVGISHAGGLAGANSGMIEQSSAVGSVALTGSGDVGGLVGAQNAGTLAQDFAGSAVGWQGPGTGPSAGTSPVALGGLAGSITGGVVEDSYSAGSVTTAASNNANGVALGGLAGSVSGGNLARDLAIGIVRDTATDQNVTIGGDSGQVLGSAATGSNVYWDQSTSGLTADSAGGFGTGLTSAALSSILPAGFAAGTWQIAAGALFPYLTWQAPSAPDVISGTVSSASIGGSVQSGQVVNAVLNGKALNSLLSSGNATSFADGSYEFLLPSGSIATGKNLVLTADGGQTLLAGTTGSVAGLAIAADTVWLNSASTSAKSIFAQYLSGLGATPADAEIGATGIIPLNATNTLIFAGSGASLTMDQAVANIPNFTLALSNPTAIGQSVPLVVSQLLLEGGTVNLNNAGNAITQLAGQTGALALATSGSIDITNFGGVNGLSAAGFLNIAAVHNIIGTAPISVSGTGAQATLYADSKATDQGYVLLPGGFQIPYGTLTVFDHPPGFPNPSGVYNNVVGKLIYYQLLDSQHDLTQIAIAPGASFALNTNINLTGNFTPISRFAGVLNGFGYSINNLSITDNTGGNFGMFVDNAGTIENINFGNVSILNTATSPGGGEPIGGFGPVAGINDSAGVINNVTVSGAVTSSSGPQGRGVGGIVGYNDGTISNSFSAASVTAPNSYIGGVAGGNNGTIILSGESGQVLSTSSNSTIGGLVASNFGTISQSYATGNVSAGSGSNIGGLVAVNYATIKQSFATGTVQGGTGAGNTGSLNGESVGGLVGWNYSGPVSDSYATGAVSGGPSIGSAVTYVGGVIGLNYDTATNIYAAGAVSGGSGADVGALVGSGSVANGFFDPALSATSKAIGNGSGSTGTFTVSSTTGTARFGGFAPAIWTFPATPRALPYLAFQTGLFPGLAAPPPPPPKNPPPPPKNPPPPPKNPPPKTPTNSAAAAAAAIIAKANQLAAQLIKIGLTTRAPPAGKSTIAPKTAGSNNGVTKPLNLSGFDAGNSVMVDVALINDPTNTMLPNPATMMTTTISYDALGLDGAPINVSNSVMNNGIPTGSLAQAAQSDSAAGTSLADLFGQGGLTPTGLAPGSIIFATGVSSAGASFAGMPGQGGMQAGSFGSGSIVGATGISSAGAASINPTTVTAPGPGTKAGKGTGGTSAAPYTTDMGVQGYDSGQTTSGIYDATAPAAKGGGGGSSDPLGYGPSGLTPDSVAGTPLSNGQDIIANSGLNSVTPAGNLFSKNFNPPAPSTPSTPSTADTPAATTQAATTQAASTPGDASVNAIAPLSNSLLNANGSTGPSLGISSYSPTASLVSVTPAAPAPVVPSTPDTGLTGSTINNPNGDMALGTQTSVEATAKAAFSAAFTAVGTAVAAASGPAGQYNSADGSQTSFAGSQDYQMMQSYTVATSLTPAAPAAASPTAGAASSMFSDYISTGKAVSAIGNGTSAAADAAAAALSPGSAAATAPATPATSTGVAALISALTGIDNSVGASPSAGALAVIPASSSSATDSASSAISAALDTIIGATNAASGAAGTASAANSAGDTTSALNDAAAAAATAMAGAVTAAANPANQPLLDTAAASQNFATQTAPATDSSSSSSSSSSQAAAKTPATSSAAKTTGAASSSKVSTTTAAKPSTVATISAAAKTSSVTMPAKSATTSPAKPTVATPKITDTGSKTATGPSSIANKMTATPTTPKTSAKPTAAVGSIAAKLQPTKLTPVVVAGAVSAVQPSGASGKPFIIGITTASAP
ncbi:MAG TPA: filamentous hemagglutinin N-terminal domain-containing protein [Acetobacteraceae bacterium]|nr:filamentous hemagglutinin N-terminal domain-containing protein [Acetobacteraceae bacterium]